ncbi:MAG: methyltransferase domain-containing protein [Phycisphaerae bacterium]|nr:methyltransferase domain-containing protein [Phycisphaerae bacterium]
MNFTGERFIPGVYGTQIALEHWHRYRVAAQYCKGKNVIDIASGEGYGSNHLAQCADHVTGFDIDQDAVAHAQKKYQRDNLTYQLGSVTQIPALDHSVDVVVSFETIEHIDEEIQNKFLQEVIRVLKKDGLFIVSTPDKFFHSDQKNYQNEFHIKEFYKEEFQTFLENHFANVFFGYQQVYTASILKSDRACALETYAIEKQEDKLVPLEQPVEEFEYIIALCSQSELPALPSSVNIDISNSLASEYLARNNSKYIQLFIDTGDGFSEAQSLHEPFVGTSEVVFDLSKFDSIVALRLDPLNDFIIVSILPIEIRYSDENIILINPSHSNASIVEDDRYGFLTNDPQMVYEVDNSLGYSIKQVKVYMKFHAIADEAINVVQNQFQRTISEQQGLLRKKDDLLIIQNKELGEKIGTIGALEERVLSKETIISEQQGLLRKKDDLLIIQNKELGEKIGTIGALEERVLSKETIISEQQGLLEERTDSIVLLRKQFFAEYEKNNQMILSFSWRITTPLRFIEKLIKQL